MAVAGSHVVTHADGTEFDLGGEWRVRSRSSARFPKRSAKR